MVKLSVYPVLPKVLVAGSKLSGKTTLVEALKKNIY